MPKQLMITLSDQKYKEFSQLALAENRDVTEVIEEQLEHEPVSSLEPRRVAMRREIAAYQQLHPQLMKTHLGKTVAIFQGEMVDFDADPVALLQRIRVKFPNEVVLRRKVEVEMDPELRFRSLRFI